MANSIYDLAALEGAAEFFEKMATGADPAPLAFAQAIRRVLPDLEIMAAMEDDADRELTAEEQASTDAIVEGSWQRFVEMLPAAKVINDNQPGNQAVIVVLRDPPTLPVGTVLYTSYRGMDDNRAIAPMLDEMLRP